MVSPWQKQWNNLIKREAAYLKRSVEKKVSTINNMLEEKVPPKLQGTLNIAFVKAFKLIFEKGTKIIEKTYQRENVQRQFKVNRYAVDLKENRKSLRQFSKQASKTGRKNLLISGLEGIGLGALGIGLPDIALFTGMLLKSIYEISLHYGYDYEQEVEKYFILHLIQTSLSHDEELTTGNQMLNEFIENYQLPLGYSQDTQIEQTATVLSNELLYMKFLQGLPVIGIIGGAYNPIYLQKVQKYAKLKYERRFLHDYKGKM
ncbi:EcsC family protein [Anaerorhabdus sp.]|uniref:EcsC family protein n=1 Tax=Anaerorhabdus sp. TaxID=1872524 RepID=UPI002FC6DA08